MKRSPKKPCACTDCGRRMFARRVNSAKQKNQCKACRHKKRRLDYQRRKAAIRERHRLYYLAHREEIKARTRAWTRQHREQRALYNRRYAMREHQRNAALIASLPCFECGERHTQEVRDRLLRRFLPCSTMDLHEIRPCIWGPGGKSVEARAGVTMLWRDLKRIGAIRTGYSSEGAEYALPERRAA